MAAGGGLIGALRVSLGLETANFEAGTKRARSIAQRDVTAIQKTLGQVKGAFAGLATVATVTSFAAAAKRALDYTASLGEVAQQLGVTTRDLQVYRYVAQNVGIEQAEMDKGLQRLTFTMGQAADGSKKQVAAFKELGPAVEAAVASGASAGEVLPLMADAFAKVENSAKRARLEREFFGKSGQQMDTLLSQGGQVLRDYAAEAERLGLILGDDLIKKADDASDRLGVLAKVMEVRFAKAVTENSDGVLAFADTFISLIGAIGSALSALQSFGHEARLVFNSLKGWDLFGNPVDSEDGRRARMRYFGEKVDQDVRNERGNVVKTAVVRKHEGSLNAKGGGAKAKKPEKDRTAQYEARFQADLRQAHEEQLRDEYAITTDIQRRADIQRELTDLEYASRLASIKNEENYTTEQKRRLTEELDKRFGQNASAGEDITVQHSALTLAQFYEKRDAQIDRDLDLATARLDNQSVLLRGELDEARTQSDRRRIQLQILRNQQAEERATLEAVKAKHKSTDTEYIIAQQKLDQLDVERKQREGAINRDTMGPLAQYLDSLPKTAAEINEAFEAVAANGLQSLTDGIAGAIFEGKNLGAVFKNVANQIISDLMRIAVQKAVTGAIGDALGGIFGGGGSGLTKSIKSGLSSAKTSGLPKFAKGGEFKIGGPGGVDNQVLSIGGIQRAMVSGSESVRVIPANDRGSPRGTPISFDLRGAVMTADLLQQMQTIAVSTGGELIGHYAEGQGRALKRRL